MREDVRMTLRKEDILDTRAFDRACEGTDNPLPLFRDALKAGREQLRQHHLQKARAVEIVHTHAWLVDQLLVRAWRHHLPMLKYPERIALIAVGGYGRGELHPASDVDLMFLLSKRGDPGLRKFVETIVRFFWDMGIEVGHSLRTLKDCVAEAKKDITVATNLMEARMLHGDTALLEKMQVMTGPKKLWPSKKFFAAKWEEQITRHHNFHDTAYNLEPNVKEGPGGLRDIQMISWVTQRQFGTHSLHDLVPHGFLTEEEYRALIRGRNFLWQIRNGLHFLAKRREDRLLFDHQRSLAKEFGFEDHAGSLAVEQLMKRYFRTIKELSLLNEILLQHMQEAILQSGRQKVYKLNRRFQERAGFLETTNDKVFEHTPYAMLELFLVMAQHPQLKGVRANTIRQLRANLYRIDRDFRKDITNRSLFMEILRQPQGITHEMRRMNAYGVLGAYLPPFGKIVGQMQHDLFHVYTVDEHVLFVLRNLRRFTVPEFRHEFPMASQIIRSLIKPERLYIAALFHDIAKGRGGDHSELGEAEVRRFCKQHDLSDYDTRFICWLVRQHLIMSWSSQHLDINDPEVVRDFARKMVDKEHLDALYLLTVADMRGTSPTVWNAWKGGLLAQLYSETVQQLRRGLAEPVDAEERAGLVRSEALQLLSAEGVETGKAETLWQGFGDHFFLRHPPDAIAWYARMVLSDTEGLPVVASRYLEDMGATEFMVYCREQAGIFRRMTGVFARQNLNVVEARLYLTEDDRRLDTFVVLDHDGEAIQVPAQLKELNGLLRHALTEETTTPYGQTRLPRQLKHFPLPTMVQFSTSINGEYTLLEIITQDRPGLLHQIAQVLDQSDINIASARIATFGERAEDIFFITDREGRPLADAARLDALQRDIVEHLDEQRLAS